MNSSFWEKHTGPFDIDCLELKDRLQERVRQDTIKETPEAVVEYFREASRRFQMEQKSFYQTASAAPMSVREPEEPAPEK
jgi:hypothetical protein